jgi:hypothetical protein
MIAIVDPRTDAVMVGEGEGHAPVVAVLRAAVKKQNESMSAPKGIGPRHSRIFLLQIGTF